MSTTALSYDDADAVWDVLVELAGAAEDDRRAFVRYLTDETAFPHEWRFCGLLGFGGKLHTNHHPAVSVSCYREDRDEVRDAIIAVVNARLAAVAASPTHREAPQ